MANNRNRRQAAPKSGTAVIEVEPDFVPGEITNEGVIEIEDNGEFPDADDPFDSGDINQFDDDDDDVQDVGGPTMTRADTFMAPAPPPPEVIDEVLDSGAPEVLGEKMYKIRVAADVGPVYYGDDRIEFKAGHMYRMPRHIAQYLSERGLIVGQ